MASKTIRACVVALLASIAALAAPGVPAVAAAATHTIHGTVVVRGGVSLGECAGTDDQGDIHRGTLIALRDDAHHQIARARLGTGSGGGGGLDQCTFRFTMRDIASHPSYSFVVADRAPERKVTRAQLATHDWRITLKPA